MTTVYHRKPRVYRSYAKWTRFRRALAALGRALDRFVGAYNSVPGSLVVLGLAVSIGVAASFTGR